MTSTYQVISTTTVSGTSTTSIDMTSIPSTYTDLVAVFNGGFSINDALIYITVNNDTGANYSYTQMYGNGSSAGSGSATSANNWNIMWYPYPNTATGVGIFNFHNYSSTSMSKTLTARIGASNVDTRAVAGLWNSTAAITSVKFTMSTYASPYFVAGTTVTLYGIKAA